MQKVELTVTLLVGPGVLISASPRYPSLWDAQILLFHPIPGNGDVRVIRTTDSAGRSG